VNTQSREHQRKKAQKLGAKNRSGTDMPAAMSFKIWNTISQFHPYKNEILWVVKILNSIGANCKIIAAILGLQGWKTFYGNGEWTEEEVQDLLQGFRA
jgi:hypothetical protein